MNKRKYTFDTSGFSCQNTDCHKYHKVNEGNVRFAYMSGKYKQIAYLKCTACGRCFSENKGAIFFRRKKSKETITRVLQNTVEGCGIRATGRVFGISKDTVLAWVKAAGEDSLKVEKKYIQKPVFQ